MVRHDPELRGRDLFEQHCASCHVLGDLGDPEKSTATNLDGWGQPEWIAGDDPRPRRRRVLRSGPLQGRDAERRHPPEEERSRGGLDRRWSRAPPRCERSRSSWRRKGTSPAIRRARSTVRRARSVRRSSASAARRCHLYKGQGDDEGSDLAPELAGYGSIAWTRAQVANPATPQTYREKALDEAMKKHMPRFDKDLSAADVDIVARCTRSHARATAFVATAGAVSFVTAPVPTGRASVAARPPRPHDRDS